MLLKMNSHPPSTLTGHITGRQTNEGCPLYLPGIWGRRLKGKALGCRVQVQERSPLSSLPTGMSVVFSRFLGGKITLRASSGD